MERTYTDRGELYQLKHASTTIDTRAYDNGGRLTSNNYNNGVNETRAYNTDNTLASITFGGSGTGIGNMTYGWDVLTWKHHRFSCKRGCSSALSNASPEKRIRRQKR